MIEPFTAACLYAVGAVANGCTVEAVSGGVAGNLADRLLCKITADTTKQFADKIVQPTNHDLLKGVIRAHSHALQFYAQTLNQQAIASDRPIADKVIEMANGSIEPDAQSLEALLQAVTPLLANPGEMNLDKRREKFVDAAITALTQSIEDQIGEDLPDRFRRLLRERAPNGRESWQERFHLYLSELIKNEEKYGTRFKNVFLAGNVAEIVGRLVTVQDIARSTMSEIQNMQTGIVSLQDKTAKILQLLEPDKEADEEPNWPKPSPVLKKLIKKGKKATLLHDGEGALEAWGKAAERAVTEEILPLEIEAKSNKAIALAQFENRNSEAMALAEECLAIARGINLGAKVVDLDLTMGEIYRVCRKEERGRGFARSALKGARRHNKPVDAAFALMSLSAFERALDRPVADTQFFALLDEARQILEDASTDPDVDRQEISSSIAEIHCWIADCVRHNDHARARAELNRAIQIIGEGEPKASVQLVRAYTQRGAVSLEQSDIEAAEKDFERARGYCEDIGYRSGQAQIDAVIAQHLMLSHRIDEAERYQLNAINRFSDSNNERYTHPYWYEYAMMALMNNKPEVAKEIFRGIYETSWVETDKKIQCAQNLWMTARSECDDDAKKRWGRTTLELLADEKSKATSASALREIDTQIAGMLVESENFDEAEKIYARLLGCLDPEEDKHEVVLLYSNMASLKQSQGDTIGEREFHDKVLAATETGEAEMFRPISLLMLAQLDIAAEKYQKAETRLSEAVAITPDHPILVALISDLRSKFPQLSPNLVSAAGRHSSSPGSLDLYELNSQLHSWVAHFPEKAEAILSIWYYVFKEEIWLSFGKIPGNKFLIFASERARFDKAQELLTNWCDYVGWALPFDWGAGELRTRDEIDIVPTPDDFLFPPGVSFLAAKEIKSEPDLPDERAGTIQRQKKMRFAKAKDEIDFRATPYVAAMTMEDGEPKAHFCGPKRVWKNKEIPNFMLAGDDEYQFRRESMCFPISEESSFPSIQRCLETSRSHHAMPVFLDKFPITGESNVRFQCEIRLPTQYYAQGTCIGDYWIDLIGSMETDARNGMQDFARQMEALCADSEESIGAQLFVFEFECKGESATYPGVLLTDI